jgi:hypothetical protein
MDLNMVVDWNILVDIDRHFVKHDAGDIPWGSGQIRMWDIVGNLRRCM